MRRLAAGMIVAALATPAAAQTNDHFFRSWRLTSAPSDPRAAALGGAVGALEDEAGTAAVNPGALVTLTKSEVKLSLQSLRPGASTPGDRLGPRTAPGLVVLGWRPSANVAIAGYLSEPYTRAHSMDLALPDGFTDTGTLEGSVTDFGAAVSWRPRPWLMVGARGAISRLAIDGSYAHEPESGAADFQVETTGRSLQPTGGLGVLIAPGPRVRLGLTAASGASFTAKRTAENPAFGVVLQDNQSYDVRAPRVFSAAFGYQPSRRLTLLLQVDRVEYQDTHSGITITQGAHARADYALDSAWEPRAGVEWSLPFRTFSVQVRAGIHVAAPALLKYTGSDAVETAVFVGEQDRVVPCGGISLVTARWLRFEISGRAAERTELLVGAAARF